MELDLDPGVLLSTAIIYIVILLGLWKVDIGGGWGLTHKIIMTIMFLPITYFICVFVNQR